MQSVPLSQIPPGRFSIACKDLVIVQRRHGDKVFRVFWIPADRLDDFKSGEEERGDTVFVVSKTSPPRKQNVSIQFV